MKSNPYNNDYSNQESQDQYSRLQKQWKSHQKRDDLKKGQKFNKQTKDSQKFNKQNKQTKQFYKVKVKSEGSVFLKGQQKESQHSIVNLKNLKEEGYNQNNIKRNIKQQSNQPSPYQNIVITQENLAKLYCQCQGDITKMGAALKQNSLFTLCKMILPIIKNALKSLQIFIKKRKLRRIFLAWNQQELKQFIHKFFEIKNGQLYGYSKKLELGVFWKLIKMKYDSTISLQNEQALEFYKSCLDLHLSVYEELQNKTTNFQRHMSWSRSQLKVFCRLLMKTDDLQKISDVLIMEFGKLKDKFSPKKLYERIDTLMKMSISKIKQQCITYPGIGDIRKMLRHDFYNLNYNQAPRYQQMRQQLIKYFQKDIPQLQQSYDILCKLNKFIDEERIYEKNQMTDSNLRNATGRQNIAYERLTDKDKSEYNDTQKSQGLVKQKFQGPTISGLGLITTGSAYKMSHLMSSTLAPSNQSLINYPSTNENQFNPESNNSASIVQQNINNGINNLSNNSGLSPIQQQGKNQGIVKKETTQKQRKIPLILKNLIQMDIQLSSSSDEQIIQPQRNTGMNFRMN